MRRSAVLLTLLVLLTAVPGAAARHEGEVLFDETYDWLGAENARDRFDVPPPDADHRYVCYVRTLDTDTKGTWSASVHDARNRLVIQDTAVWAVDEPWGGVSLPLAIRPGFAGEWFIDVHATGYSPFVNVNVTYVRSLGDCTTAH